MGDCNFYVDVDLPIDDDQLVTWNSWLSVSLNFHSIMAQYSYRLFSEDDGIVEWLKSSLQMLRKDLILLKDITTNITTDELPYGLFQPVEDGKCISISIPSEEVEEPTELETFIEMVDILQAYNRQKAQYFFLIQAKLLTLSSIPKNRLGILSQEFLQLLKEHDHQLGNLLDRAPRSCLVRYIGPTYSVCLCCLDCRQAKQTET